MRLVSWLLEFVVVHDLIPCSLKWRSVSDVGRLFKDVFYMLDAEGRRKLADVLYALGGDADSVIRMLKIRRDLHGCAIALLAAQHTFGVRSRIVRESESEVVIQADSCMWKDKEGWAPEVCAAIEAYEIGLVKGIRGDVEHICTKRRSKGDTVCEVILRKLD